MTSKIEDRLRKNGVKIKKVLQVAQSKMVPVERTVR